jgi:flagellar basal-body rod protein FlgG
MLKSISGSYTGIRSCQQMLDVVANNLANVNTTAYKERTVSFQELPYRALAERRLPLSGSPVAAPLGGKGTVLGSIASSQEGGTPVYTDYKLDLAIEGEGFFRVIREGGSYAYTRSGNFRSDAEGNIVLPGGERLDITLNPKGREGAVDLSSLVVTPDGRIMVREENGDHSSSEHGQDKEQDQGGGAPGMVELGSLKIYRFINPQGLSGLGKGLFIPSANSGPPREGRAGEEGFGSIRQGFLESSNVDMGRQMTMLIRGQRALQASARTLTAADELWAVTLQMQSG